MVQNILRPAAIAAVFSLVVSSGAAPAIAARTRHVHVASNPAATSVPHFQTQIFARGNANLFNPDGIIVTKHYVFVDYQNLSDTTPTSSTIAKYDRFGKLLGTVDIFGRSDGMRMNPYTHKIWALVNNDGQNGTTPPREPALFVIDPTSLQKIIFHFPKVQQHGGGYDDLAFVDGKAFASASAPTLTPAGINDKQAVVEIRIENGEGDVRPLFYGNTTGLDLATGKSGILIFPIPIRSRSTVTISSW